MDTHISNIRLMIITVTALIFMSCNDEKDYSSHFSNYIQLSVKGNPSLNEDETRPVNIQLMLANTLREDAIITLELSENDNNILRLSQSDITIKSGEKTAGIEILSNNKGILKSQHVAKLKVKSYSNPDMKPWNELSIIVKPGNDIPELNDEQIKLIEGYKNKWGLDLYRFIGKLSYSTTVTFNSGDLGVLYDNSDTRIYEGTSTVTLSEHSSPEHPMLKIISNPLGMTSFLWEMMRRCTIENSVWKDETNNPEPSAILKAIGYDAEKETFDVSLDGISILPEENKVTFLKQVMTSSGNEEHEIEPTWTTVVPFEYRFSAWERFVKLSETDTRYTFKEGQVSVEKHLKDAPEVYQLNPVHHLSYSNLDKDGWEEGNFVEPSASYNLEKGTLSFIFSWDCTISSGGYTQIRVTYTLNPSENN